MEQRGSQDAVRGTIVNNPSCCGVLPRFEGLCADCKAHCKEAEHGANAHGHQKLQEAVYLDPARQSRAALTPVSSPNSSGPATCSFCRAWNSANSWNGSVKLSTHPQIVPGCLPPSLWACARLYKVAKSKLSGWSCFVSPPLIYHSL